MSEETPIYFSDNTLKIDIDNCNVKNVDFSQNSNITVHSGDIMLFQSADGMFQTISITPELVAGLGTSTSPLVTPVSSQPVINTTRKQLKILPVELSKSKSLLASNKEWVTLSDFKAKKGFQVMTDYLKKPIKSQNISITSNESNPLTVNQTTPIIIDQNSTIINAADIPIALSQSIPQITTKTQSLLSNNENKSNAVVPQKFITTSGDVSSLSPLYVKNNTIGFSALHNADMLAFDGTNKTPKNNVKPKNIKNKKELSKTLIDDRLRKNLNIKKSLTPIPVYSNMARNIVVQSIAGQETINVNKNVNLKRIHVLQNGNQYHCVEKLQGEQLRVVSDALSTVVSKPTNQNNTLYDPASKTKIVYRVVYPEDLNLCSATSPPNSSAVSPTPTPPKKTYKKNPKNKAPRVLPTPQVVSVTRSGRHVCLPRHMTQDYQHDEELVGGTGLFQRESSTGPGTNDIIDMPPRKRFICPKCRKIFVNIKLMGKHFSMYSDHATNDKSVEILHKYQKEHPPKKISAISTPQSSLDKNKVQPELPNHPLANKSVTAPKADPVVDTEVESPKIEKNLFNSLLVILEKTSEEYRATVFVRQLAALILKLQRLVPCLLHPDKTSSKCYINDSVGKLLDVKPGKYNLNMNAISCLGIQSGKCTHISSTSLNDSLSNESSDVNWSTSKEEQSPKVLKSSTPEPARDNSIEKWTSCNKPKRKWIPIGSRDTNSESENTNDETWLTSNSTSIINTTTFSQVDRMKPWEARLPKHTLPEISEPRSPWQSSNLNPLPSITMSQDIIPQEHILTTKIQSKQSNDPSTFNCTSKIVGLHSDLVFDLKDQMALNPSAMELKNNINCTLKDPKNFNFDREFDKLNFANTQFDGTKYRTDGLPPFKKIEPLKNLIPVDPLDDISSDADKLNLSANNAILEDRAYPITSESLDLMTASHIDSLASTVSTCKAVTLDQNEDTVHGDTQSLLASSQLNLPITVSNTLSRNESMLSVSESSLDGGRLNLATSQSVLQLLDPLGGDLMSLSDSELRQTSQMSLDLQLDMFSYDQT